MYKELNVSECTLMTPGPVEAEPRVLRAMCSSILGQFDPEFTELMNQTMEMLRKVFQTENQWTFPIDGTSRAGIEAILCSIIEPGDQILIPIYGRFGHLLTEIAERNGANVVNIETDWGQVFDPQVVIQEIRRVKPKIVAMVHGEASTGCMQPLKEIGEACRKLDILFVVDTVATIGGTAVKVDEWKIDAAIGGTQKCLSVPSGMAPITFNSRVEAVLLQRKKIERGLADPSDLQNQQARLIRSNYFDLSQLMDYWSPIRLNHHTEATSMLYALREGLRIVLEEGLETRFARHKLHEKALIQGIQAMGLNIFGDPNCKLPVVTSVTIPDGVDGESVRHMLMQDFQIGIASSFGILKGKIWRIGSMGYSCRKKNILYLLGALEAVLIRHKAKVCPGEAVQAALDIYQNEE
ncbi:(S)-ureidoglycine-glyoxylate aminotransferase [Sporomusaceae bacterium BoRhaA]|uniref:pyridoxal-phosphate-dependent aminotransferase family protein n=1 Tax=Pelorhabdus rhamnosifermentans TaxID=2772457 RepID=UPI001C060782|nr:alanine--glyoxylate aminotransferase family protein [Pelorhabdus rhamnosifermentans]MBU2702477.1 (S)-ureidoglycine-glyoxylate aminotransferase [Pelorhabdus rhamnosifermentans]